MSASGLLQLARLLQLASPALPVGAYSYSQGLESAVSHGIVRDAASAERWISDVLDFSVARMEAPLFLQCHDAWRQGDAARAAILNEYFLASREAGELRAETVQMGYSLNLLLPELDVEPIPFEQPAFPVVFSRAAAAWEIAADAALLAYLWSWAENQVIAALKAVPLGQTAGQRMLRGIGACLPGLIGYALQHEYSGNNSGNQRGDFAVPRGNFAPGFALLAAKHETQYSRLFRS